MHSGISSERGVITWMNASLLKAISWVARFYWDAGAIGCTWDTTTAAILKYWKRYHYTLCTRQWEKLMLPEASGRGKIQVAGIFSVLDTWSDLGLEEAICFIARNCKHKSYSKNMLISIICWIRHKCRECQLWSTVRLPYPNRSDALGLFAPALNLLWTSYKKTKKPINKLQHSAHSKQLIPVNTEAVKPLWLNRLSTGDMKTTGALNLSI